MLRPQPTQPSVVRGTKHSSLHRVRVHALMSACVSPQGLMLKRLDAGSAYQPSKRSESWIKIKRCVRHVKFGVRCSGGLLLSFEAVAG